MESEPQMTDRQMVEAYSAQNLEEAHFIKSILGTAGIDSRVLGASLQYVIGDVPYINGAVQVIVAREDYQTSRQIVLEYDARQKARYERSKPWKCLTCGEENEAHFDLCWQCEVDRE